jgi:hypothetical protein
MNQTEIEQKLDKIIALCEQEKAATTLVAAIQTECLELEASLGLSDVEFVYAGRLFCFGSNGIIRAGKPLVSLQELLLQRELRTKTDGIGGQE